MNQLHHYIQHAYVSVLRAIGADQELELSFTQTPAPYLRDNTAILPEEIDDETILRGMIDHMALQTLHHDKQLLRRSISRMPEHDILLEAAEEARVHSLGIEKMPGMMGNLDAFIQHEEEEKKESLPWYYAIRAMLTERKVLGLPEKIIQRYQSKLHAAQQDQKAFMALVEEMLRDMAVKPQQSPKEEQEEEKEKQEETQAPQPQSSGADEGETSVSMLSKQLSSFHQEASAARESYEELSDTSAHERSGVPEYYDQPREEAYQVFTHEFDQIVRAEDLVDAEEAARLSQKFEEKIAALGQINHHQASRMLRHIIAKQQQQWQEHLEDGLIDIRKLPVVVADPSYRHCYRMKEDDNEMNTVVSLLIDNSGSMRGRPITIAALSARILTKLLEDYQVKVEVLGFTTMDWKGGHARKAWVEAGQPANPGRLNDLRHIIYKSADVPWNKAKRYMGVMLKEGLLKENIDGEALLWAHSRLLHRPERRKILMVISDGAPVDDSTLSVNHSGYLDHHLYEVVERLQNKSAVEMLAIGIGHDVSRYYARSTTIRDIDQLGEAMFKQLADLLEGKGRG